MIQMVVDPQHTQSLKKTKQNFNLAKRSHSNHIHLKIARHGNKEKVQV
jgi:hypothetical protein